MLQQQPTNFAKTYVDATEVLNIRKPIGNA